MEPVDASAPEPGVGPVQRPRVRPRVRPIVVVLAAVLASFLVFGVIASGLAPSRAKNVPTAAATATASTSPLDTGVAGALIPLAADSPTPPPPDQDAVDAAAIQQVLDARDRAVAADDVGGFLDTVATNEAAFVDRQAMFADNLVSLPFDAWSTRVLSPLDGADDVAGPVMRRFGDSARSYAVQVRYRLEGFGSRVTVSPRTMTFVPDGGTWKVVGDTDTGVYREPWDVAPLRAVTAPGVLMLVSGDAVPVSSVLRQAQAAVRDVSAIWGRDWDRRVVIVVPSSQTQLGTMLRRDGDGYTNLAAVATAEVRTNSTDEPVNRVWVNPSAFQRITALGRSIVLRHEITHVATGAAVPSDFAIWLEEGFADYVGYRDAGVRPQVVAGDLLDDARSGRVPKRLPTKSDFRSSNPRFSQAYEGAWWAARLIAQEYGEDALIRVYRAALAQPDRRTAVDTALRSELGISTEQLTARWRESIAAAVR